VFSGNGKLNYMYNGKQKCKCNGNWKYKYPGNWKCIKSLNEDFHFLLFPVKLYILYDLTGVEMVKTKMYKQIQTLKRKGYSKTKISSELNLNSRTTVKYFHMAEKDFRIYRQQHMYRDKALDIYEKDILEVYEQNEFKRLNMSAVYDYLEEKHGSLPCNEKTLRNFIKYLLDVGKLKLNENVRTYSKVPELPLGKQMQLDFGQYQLGNGLKLYIFVAVLSASRYKYIIFQDNPFQTKDVICHLLDCFDFFGGIPAEMVIDQDRLLVVSENRGDIIFTKDFKYFIEEIGIRMHVCRKADPESKGKVENSVKYVKRNFLEVRDFSRVEEANAGVLKWLKRRANGKISQATRQIPSIMIEKERENLKPLVNSIFRKNSLIGREDRNVDDKGRISIHACAYQLPSKYRNKTVDVYITPHIIFVFDQFSGEEIVSYNRSPLPGKLISRREYQREPGKLSRALKSDVMKMFDDDQWNRFVEKNFKAFPRYVRDQCIEAKRHFGDKEVDLVVLGRALHYCLENSTFSFGNLKDTYNHFGRELNRSQGIQEAGISRHPIVFLNPEYQGKHNHKPLPVASRDVKSYQAMIPGGGD
jgi:hypothetical protein